MAVLCVVAHPDDEVLGVGGTLARHAEAGEDVHVVVLGKTGMSRDEPARPERRQAETRSACDVLGVSSVRFHEFPENEFDAVALLDLVQRVEAAVARVDPRVVYTHHYSDLNISHELTCRAVLTATRPLPETTVERVLAFETLSSTEWSTPRAGNHFEPTVFVDVSTVLDAKCDALREHETELREWPHPRSVGAVEANALLWGAKSGLDAAEPFELLREVRGPEAGAVTDGRPP